MDYDVGDVLYENPLSRQADIEDFHAEGDVLLTFPHGRLRMQNAVEPGPDAGVHGNFLFWCPETFPDDIAVSWDFQPFTDAGLAMFWIAATGRNGEDLFDPSLAPRNGDYRQYNRGDINALHQAYYRRNPSEIGFQTCNLRKSHGFHLVARRGDPIPDSCHATGPYRMQVVKSGPDFQLHINDLLALDWHDDGDTYGPVLGGGKIGFRQMAGLVAEYADLAVHKIIRKG